MFLNKIKKQNIALKSQGSAIIAVLCVLAILFALCASLLLATNLIVNNNAQYKDRIQCKLAANSFSGTIEDKLGDAASDFTKYVNSELKEGIWEYYNPDEPGHQYHSITDKIFNVEVDGFKYVITIFHSRSANDDPINTELIISIKAIYKEQKYVVNSIFNRTAAKDATDDTNYYWYLAWNEPGKSEGDDNK
ncbi:MAG: hypothetical protein ACLR9T_06260 [Thomasclavelia sp.]|uniref:hypothetical protein n=1 Tax=Thomasclavelia sp. TaxID=3025757 RepID=UPI0039A1770E